MKNLKKIMVTLMACLTLVGTFMFISKENVHAATNNRTKAVLDFGDKNWIRYYAGSNANLTGATATPQGLKEGTELVYLSSVINRNGVEIAYCYVPSLNVYCYISSKYVKAVKETPILADGVYTIHSKLDSNKVLDVADWNYNNGANVQLWDYTGANNQKFKVTHVSDGCYIIESVYSKKLVDVAGGNVSNTNNIQMYRANGTAAQKFIIKDAGNGYYKITSSLNENYVLDCAWGNSSNGTNIFLYEANSSDAQLFSFKAVNTQSTTTDNVKTEIITPETTNVTYEYRGEIYNVVDGFNTKYVFNQLNYGRYVNSQGKNAGCTAVAMASAYSMYNNTHLDPNSSSIVWTNGVGVRWTTHSMLTKYYSTNLTAVKNYVEEDIPVIIRLKKINASTGHSVTVVGIRKNADMANLSMRDFLVSDPWGGAVRTLAEACSNIYKLDGSWELIIPIKK